MTTNFKIDIDLDKLPIVAVNWASRTTWSTVGGGYVKDDYCVFIFPCNSEERAIKLLEHHRLTVKKVENTKRPTMEMIKEAEVVVSS